MPSYTPAAQAQPAHAVPVQHVAAAAATAGVPAQPGAWRGRYWFALAGLLLVLVGVFLPWVQYGSDLSVYPLWGDFNEFRIDEWLGTSAVDGLIVLGLSAAGVVSLLMQRSGGPSAVTYLRTWAVCALLLVPLLILEVVYIADVATGDGAGLGFGIVVYIVGVVIYSLPLLVPYAARRWTHSEDVVGEGVFADRKPWE